MPAPWLKNIQWFSLDEIAEIWAPELKLPTPIILGGRDRLPPLGDAERFHHDVAGSRLVIFPDLGHAPQEEDSARTAAAVIDFLQAR